ncbi:MAG: stage III sporulation protein AB [Peptococcaceae bacterium]|nr:stage III sporulation protein AB [Peptococcaceae bacterium]
MLLVGYAGLIVGFGLLGLIKANKIRNRPREIREIINALSLLDTEIFWGVTPLPEAFAILKNRAEPPWNNFFAQLEIRLRKGENAFSAWEICCKEHQNKTCLIEEDWKVLRSIGKGLGRSDRNEQHKQLQLAQKHLIAIDEKARAQADHKAKLWSYLGFLGGLAIVIVIM